MGLVQRRISVQSRSGKNLVGARRGLAGGAPRLRRCNDALAAPNE